MSQKRPPFRFALLIVGLMAYSLLLWHVAADIVLVFCGPLLVMIVSVIFNLFSEREHAQSSVSLIDDETILSSSKAIFLGYQYPRRYASCLIKKILSCLSISGHIYCHVFRNTGVPYLEFEPINGILYLTNYRIIFAPTLGQSIKSLRSTFIRDVVQIDYCDVFFKTQLLSIQTPSCRIQLVIKCADKWTEAIEERKKCCL